MINNERKRRTARRSKRFLNKIIMRALSSILILENRTKIEIISKEGIEEVCNNENKGKFTQTIRTLAMRGNLMKELGFLGNSIAYH